MGYLANEPQTFINIKLSDLGRRQLSLGQLNFSKAVLSDREVNYGIDRSSAYDILQNRILSPVDSHPTFSNFDGTDAVLLTNKQVASAKQFATATTVTTGFFTGSTNAFALDSTKYKGRSSITYTTCMPDGGITITGDTGGYTAQTGDLVWIPWQPIQNSATTYSNDDLILSANSTPMLWYRVLSVNAGTNTFQVDRPIPNFSSVSTQQFNIYFYPYEGIEGYYGSAATVDAQSWNLSIVRTASVVGTQSTFSGFTSYGSIEFNGTKHYLGFSAETPVIGLVHYTNAFTGNTYAEQLIEKSVVVTMPTILWHNVGADNGLGTTFGVALYDIDGDTTFDTVAQTTYRYLKDSASSTGKIVGRVYHKLKLIVITDPELLTAMSYKSDRNFTLPQAVLDLSSTPKFPLVNSDATGLCQSGYTYFTTYIVESDQPYLSGATFGYGPVLHCEYISSIEGNVIDDEPQFLSVSFPTKSFPYLRSSANINSSLSLSGTGWNANSIQLLVNEQATSLGYSIGNVPSTGWKRVSGNGVGTPGNGIYTGDTGDLSIDPLKLAGLNFIVSREDFDSGSTYVLNTMFTGGTDHLTTGLTFGNESFFFGNVDANIMATTFKSVITVFAKNADFNSSDNESYDSTLDENTYITEIGILDSSSNLVAVGKPTYPIRKSQSRFLAFQLEIDF